MADITAGTGAGRRGLPGLVGAQIAGALGGMAVGLNQLGLNQLGLNPLGLNPLPAIPRRHRIVDRALTRC